VVVKATPSASNNLVVHILGTSFSPMSDVTCEVSSDDSEALAAGKIDGVVIPTPQPPEITVSVYDKDGVLIGSDSTQIDAGATSWEESVGIQPGFRPGSCNVRFFSVGPPASPSQANPTTSTIEALPGIVRCAPSTMPPAIRPTTIYFGCASGDISVANIKWQSWNTSSAIGTGTLNVNSCQPDCASGQEQTYAATVNVSDPGTVNGESVFQQVEAGPTGFSDGPAETGSKPGQDWGAP
jgi:hypothetical protein